MLSANGEGDAPEGRQDAEYQVGDKKPPLHTRFTPSLHSAAHKPAPTPAAAAASFNLELM